MSTDLTISNRFCTTCGKSRGIDDRYCGQCGAQFVQNENANSLIATNVDTPADGLTTSPQLTSPEFAVSISPSLAPILNNRWIVIGILAAVGPIGLPALWFSPRFRPWVKLTISIVYFLLTALLPLALAWYWLDFALRPLADVF